MRAALRIGSVIVCLCVAAPALAQTTPVQPRVLLDLGGAWIGGGSLGSTDATYTTPSGQSFTLFSTSQSWSGGAGVIAHVQVRLTPRIALEAAESWTRPEIRASISGDFEGAANTTATSTVSQFITSGGIVISMKPRGKWTPFLRGTVGWLRHLSNDETFYQDGVSYDIGAGVKYAWRQKSGHVKPYGLRADVWLNVRSGGLELAQKSKVMAPGFSAAFIFKL